MSNETDVYRNMMRSKISRIDDRIEKYERNVRLFIYNANIKNDKRRKFNKKI